jgi:cysteine-rich repeat protein
MQHDNPFQTFVVVTLLALLTACSNLEPTQCSSGSECPHGQTCSEQNGAPICTLVACGNGRLDPGEVCDDGNLDSNDGCKKDCKSTERCGDGMLDDHVKEECDDANILSGDGCSDTCRREVCGNGILDPGESCDDKNVESNDGCSDDCRNEFCGDGRVQGDDEECDDSNETPNDGCSPHCTRECGDGKVTGAEQCDPDSGVPLLSCIEAGSDYDMGAASCNDCKITPTDSCHAIQPVSDGPTPSRKEAFNAVWALSAEDIFVVGAKRKIYRYFEKVWSEEAVDDEPGAAPLPALLDIWGQFAVGENGTILQRNAAEQTWSPMLVGTADLHGVWGSSASNAYAVGAEGTILHFDGDWAVVVPPNPTAPDLHDVWGSSPESVYAVGAAGTILRRSGTTWSPATPPLTSEDLYGIWGSSDTDIYVVGNAGTVLHYDGEAWRPSEYIFPKKRLLAVWGNSADDIFVVGRDDTILHYDGSAWSPVRSETKDDLHAIGTIQGEPASTAIVVGSNGAVLHFTYPH